MARAGKLHDASGNLPDRWQEELSDDKLCTAAGEAGFKRGLAYFAQGRVKLAKNSLDDTANSATFKVKGTQTYTTALWFEEDLLDCSCSCPHAGEGAFCKHMVAAALFWRAKLEGKEPSAHEIPAQAAIKSIATTKRQATAASNRAALREFLNAQPASVLADRLWAWAEEDRACMGELKGWAAQSRAMDDPKALNTAITELLKSGGFLDWRDCAVYAKRAAKVLPLLENALETDPQRARAASEHALRRLYKVAETADDSGGGEIGDLLHGVLDVLLRALQAEQTPAQWVNQWFDLLADDPWGLWSDAAVLDAAGPAVQQAFSHRVAKDWQAWLAKNPPQPPSESTLVKKPLKNDPFGDRFAATGFGRFDMARARLRRRYLDDLKRQGDSQTAFEVMRTSLADSREHCALVEFCEALNKPREALQFARAAYKLYPSDHPCEAALLRCYDRDGWDQEALALRRQQLENSPTADHYLALLKTAQIAGHDPVKYRAALMTWAEQYESGGDWPRTQGWPRRSTTGSAKTSPCAHVSIRVAWLLSEHAVDEALALVQPPHVCAPGLLLALARTLPVERHAEAVPLLLRVFACHMPTASTPYREVLALVAETAARMQQPERGQWLAGLRAEHKPKRNFIKGLEGLS